MRKINFILFLLLFSILLYGANEKNLIVTHRKGRVYAEPSAFSKQKTRLKFGTRVNVIRMVGKWVEISTRKKKGFIHIEALINEKGFQRQAQAIKKRKSRKTKGGVKGFSEEEEITAGTKGFSEEEEITAGTKGFSEEEEITAGTKGFNKDVEARYKRKHRGLRYDLVDRFEKAGNIKNIQRRYRKWRKKGKLGEFGTYYSGKRG